jgi:hypothetical protein
MTRTEIRALLAEELGKDEAFDNWHGITRDNLQNHLVEPFLVTASVDEGGHTDTEEMWVVLRERAAEASGYLIAYCPSSREWCLVERLENGVYLCDTAGEASLAAALSSM